MVDAFLLSLRGPLQSYADRGFGQIRKAGVFPSRSAVLGIIAAAMGMARNDPHLVDLHNAFRVHVGVVRHGRMETDFHTVDAGGKNKTLTYRDYHHDAYFVALIEARTSEDASFLAQAREALRAPYYAPYLGRRSCIPSVPLLPATPQGSHVIAALLNAVEGIGSVYRRKEKTCLLFIDGLLTDADVKRLLPENRAHSSVRYGERRDSLSSPRRTYVGRPFTEIVLTSTPSDDPQNAYFDAAS